MNKFIIYGRPGCGYCVRAKQICEARNFEFDYIDIWEKGISQSDLENIVGKPVFTVPQIFYGEQHVGGCDDFVSFIKSPQFEAAVQ